MVRTVPSQIMNSPWPMVRTMPYGPWAMEYKFSFLGVLAGSQKVEQKFDR